MIHLHRGRSMFLGFFAWHRELARGGVAKVSKVHLVQPLLTVTKSGMLLFGQHLDPTITTPGGSSLPGRRTASDNPWPVEFASQGIANRNVSGAAAS